jgi:Conserved TM helix
MSSEVDEVLKQTISRITNALANFLPGLLALLVIIPLAIMIAFILRVVVRRSLERVRFDNRLDQWGFSAMAEFSPAGSPSQLIARIVFLAILGVGILIGLSALDSSLPSMLIVQLFDYLPNAAAAIVIMFVGVIVARFVARSVLIGAVNMQLQSARLLSVGVKWLVLVLTLAMALDHLRIGGLVVQLSFAILFGGIVLALALAVGLGSKEMVRRSWERQEDRIEHKAEEEQFHHL